MSYDSDDENYENAVFGGFTDEEIAEATLLHGLAEERDSDLEVDIDDFIVDSDTDNEASDIDSSDDDSYSVSDTATPGTRNGASSKPQKRQRRATTNDVWTSNLATQPDIDYIKADNQGVEDHDEMKNMTPIQLFCLFFTEYLLGIIVTETNRYAAQCREKGPKRGQKHLPWEPVDIPEMKTWLGLILNMGIIDKKGRLQDYWTTHPTTRIPIFGETMPCQRFMQILRYLHFVNNEDPNLEKSVKTHKVQRVLDYCVKKFRSVYVPRCELSLDETMVKFKGRLSIKKLCEDKANKIRNKIVYLG